MASITALQRQLAALEAMTVRELQEQYLIVFGHEIRTHNRPYLTRKIAWRIQEQAEGGLSDRARRKIGEMSKTVPIRHGLPRAKSDSERDIRLPAPGTVLRRTYGGKEHRVHVAEDDFEYSGKRYATISQVARAITQKNWNGFMFFNLAERKS